MAISSVKANALSMSCYITGVVSGGAVLYADLLSAYVAAGGSASSPLGVFFAGTYADAGAAASAFAALGGTIHANAVNADYIDCSFQTATGITFDQDADAGVIRIALTHSISA